MRPPGIGPNPVPNLANGRYILGKPFPGVKQDVFPFCFVLNGFEIAFEAARVGSTPNAKLLRYGPQSSRQPVRKARSVGQLTNAVESLECLR